MMFKESEAHQNRLLSFRRKRQMCIRDGAGPGIRVDTHIAAGGEVPPFYDSLLGKLIVHGESREAAVRLLQSALANLVIEGVPTTTGLHRRIAADPRFATGGVDTGFLLGLPA